MKRGHMFVAILAAALSVATAAGAMTIQTEIPVMNPASTHNMWGYYYDGNPTYINAAHLFVGPGDPYDVAVFQGYVTSDHGPWVDYHTDSWGDGGMDDSSDTVHVFVTYVKATDEHKVKFSAAGDDGFSIFINDTFIAGGDYWNKLTYDASPTFTFESEQMYKLTYIGSNTIGSRFAWHFQMRNEETGWTGRVSENPLLVMNANPVPVPASVLLLGIGLAGMGIVSFCRRISR